MRASDDKIDSPTLSKTESEASEGMAVSSTIGLSGLASFIGLCCIGPWSVALFGVSGAVALARFQPLRPGILALAALMLIVTSIRLYKSPIDCPDGTCEPKRKRWQGIAFGSAVLIFLLALFAEDLQWLVVDPTPPWLRE